MGGHACWRRVPEASAAESAAEIIRLEEKLSRIMVFSPDEADTPFEINYSWTQATRRLQQATILDARAQAKTASAKAAASYRDAVKLASTWQGSSMEAVEGELCARKASAASKRAAAGAVE